MTQKKFDKKIRKMYKKYLSQTDEAAKIAIIQKVEKFLSKHNNFMPTLSKIKL